MEAKPDENYVFLASLGLTHDENQIQSYSSQQNAINGKTHFCECLAKQHN